MKLRKSVFRNFALITQLGVHIMAPIFLCIFVGLWIDEQFNTQSMLILLFLGILAGGRNAYRLAMHSIEVEKKEKEEEKDE